MEKIITTLSSTYISARRLLKMNKLLAAIIEKYGQVIKFAIAGATGAILEFGLFMFLTTSSFMHYLVANLIAITTAIIVNYIISQKWVFESGRYSKRTEFMAFIAISALVISLNQLLMWGFVDYLYINPEISKISAITLVAFFNFFAKKYLVFKQ